jgi:eukaryotic-like serine/threonine-protein kinase
MLPGPASDACGVVVAPMSLEESAATTDGSGSVLAQGSGAIRGPAAGQSTRAPHDDDHAALPDDEARDRCTCPACRSRVDLTTGAATEPSWLERSELTEPTVWGPRAGRTRPVRERSVPAPGDRIGRYVVLDVIGHGGMGVVLAAHDPELDRPVAIKLVQPSVPSAVAARAHDLLRREAQAMARLHHINVVAIHDVGTHDGRTFLAMQLVSGESLDRWLRGPGATTRSWRAVLAMCVDAGRGLAAAHRAGIVHRDVKPQNILVGDDGIARIADFGLAIAGRSEGDSAGGTPAYMAPEQHRGAASARSDQFSYCVTVFEALFRTRPFAGRSAAELAAEIEAGRVREIRRGNVPQRVLAALVRGLAAEPADRFATLDELLGALERADTGEWRTVASGSARR